jgi:DNA-binding response OmpR family regulator
MRQRNRPTRRPLHVTIVSGNQETMEGLTTYLREAGVAVYGTRRMERCMDMIPSASSAVVFFPDDFSSQDMDAAIADLRRKRRATLVVFVTGDPRRFDGFDQDGGIAPLVMAKPVWGSGLLDAIRARLEEDSSERENIG